MTVQDQIERLLRLKYSSEFLRGLDLVRQMIVRGHVSEPESITEESLRRLQHGHTLVHQWRDAERALMAIGEICLTAWLDRAGGR